MVQSSAATVDDYLAQLDPARRAEIEIVRNLVNEALPAGYREDMGFGMIGWVIPLERYPNTYNKQPLAYAGLAAQKKYNSLYLNCLYASAERTERMVSAASAAGKPLNMGKSCIRFVRSSDLPLDLIRAEVALTTPEQFIALYEAVKPPKKR